MFPAQQLLHRTTLLHLFTPARAFATLIRPCFKNLVLLKVKAWKNLSCTTYAEDLSLIFHPATHTDFQYSAGIDPSLAIQIPYDIALPDDDDNKILLTENDQKAFDEFLNAFAMEVMSGSRCSSSRMGHERN